MLKLTGSERHPKCEEHLEALEEAYYLIKGEGWYENWVEDDESLSRIRRVLLDAGRLPPDEPGGWVPLDG